MKPQINKLKGFAPPSLGVKNKNEQNAQSGFQRKKGLLGGPNE